MAAEPLVRELPRAAPSVDREVPDASRSADRILPRADHVERGPGRKFFSWYQYVVPAILFPVSYALWLRRFGGDHALAILALSLPVLFAYAIPGLGANWLGLWELNTRLRIGRMRPHHGFVFGTATSLFALACVPPASAPSGLGECLRAGFVLGSVLGFWNWLYDTHAIKSGFIVVHTRLAAEGRAAEVVATDHAPILFGVFGLCYGVVLRLVERVTPGHWDYWALVVVGNLAAVALPVLAYVFASYLRHGESGLKAYRGPLTGGNS